MRDFVGLFFVMVVLSFSDGAFSAEYDCPVNNTSGSIVNNIWCSVNTNYNGSGQSVCLAEQYNSQTMVVEFIPSPPPGGTAMATMTPYQEYRIFGWPDGTPNIHCILIQ